jgi:signal transduction histidine kinase
MTIKKHLLIVIGIVIFVIIFANSLISTTFIERLFGGYLEDSYNQRIQEISDYAKNYIQEKNQSKSEIYDIDNFVGEPINQIVILDQNENIVFESRRSMMTMHGNMMNMMQGQERDIFELKEDQEVIGYLIIYRVGDITSTETVDMFKRALIRGTVISGIIALIIGFFATNFSSRFLSKDLRKTSDYASNILSKDNKLMDDSKIKEIRDIQDTLYNLSVRLKLKNRIRKEKADKLIHEARTPITILRTNVEGILDGIVEADEDRLQTCIKELENLTNIVENIDDVLEEKEVDIEVEEFNLSQEIDKIIKGMELQFKSKNIEIFKNIQEDILIKSDRGIINQSLYNLLSNAYKYTKEKGKVRITLEKKDNIIIKVEDNGEGISKKDEDRIFEPYYRGGTKNQEGEGLGLYITRTNLLKINGEISVTQSELGGAEFTIKL